MAWVQTGNLRGPQGIQGDPGPQGIPGKDGAPGATGPQGPQGVQGIQGETGPAGKDGRGIELVGQVPTYADLPTLTEADAGKAYLVEADGDLYVWNGASWPADGSGTDFRGPQGPRGLQGVQGEQGPAGVQGEQGPQGLPGDKGDRGSKWFTGAGAPTSLTGTLPGDMYLDTTSGTYYQLA